MSNPDRDIHPRLLPGEEEFIAWITETARKKAATSSSSLELLTSEAAADYLNISRSHLYRLVRTGKLPAGRFADGRHLAFEKKTLDEYLADLSV